MQVAAGGGTELTGPPLNFLSQRRWQIATAALVALVLAVALTAIMVTPSVTRQVKLREGEVSTIEIRAPRRAEYESILATQEARAAASAAVPPVYSPPDPRVTRQVVKRASEVFETVDWARNDPSASISEKAAMLRGVPELRDLPAATITMTLEAPAVVWQRISGHTLEVVQIAMRQPIREDRVADARRTLPNLISFNFTDAEAVTIADYAGRLLQANSLYDAAATRAAQAAAATAVKPTFRTIEHNETIIRAGDAVRPHHLEALDKLGLLNTGGDWRDILGSGLIVGLTVFALGLYVAYRNPDFWVEWRRVVLMAVVIFGFAMIAKLIVPGRTLLPYLFPGAAVAMLLTVLLEARFALSATLVLALTVSFLSGRSLELFVYILLGGIIASLSLWRVERLSAFAWAGLWVSLTHAATALAFRLFHNQVDTQGLLELSLAAFGSGFLSTCLTVVGYYLLGNIFDVTTSLRLMELARPDQPVLRDLQLKAPGTYHHSLIVSNMAEQAAHRIGADALLCRVGAYYHDIGKLKHPYFFIENQSDGVNPHDALDPAESARIILAHASDGLAMAREVGLPRALCDLIAQHHGTTLVRYFYGRAVMRANGRGPQVDEQVFRYRGPRPQSREAAILMLADCCEAAVRAKRPSTPEELGAIVRAVVQERLTEGQLDECPVTLRDLDQIRAGFECILQGVHHPRVEYPHIPEREPEPAWEMSHAGH